MVNSSVQRSLATAVVAAGLVAGGAGQANAAGADGPTTVWQHGGSNMGECSAYLGQLDVPGTGSVRAEVNHVIQQYGAYLGYSSPGDLYSVRAQQSVNLPPAQECLPRTLPGGGTG